MATSRRVSVRIREDVWAEEVGRFERRSGARLAAERERSGLESEGIDLRFLQQCDAYGTDGTHLVGLVKTYVPIGDGPPSRQPWGFVFDPDRDEAGTYLDLVAFGERHPARSASRSVYERAHRRMHGRYPSTAR